MKIKELRVLSSDELLQKEKTLKKELFQLQYQRKIGRVERPSLFKQIRREIARMQTIVNERKKDGNENK